MLPLRFPLSAVAAFSFLATSTLCLPPQPLRADEPGQPLHCQVVDEVGKPIAGATVAAFRSEGDPVTKTQSDALGEAIFPAITSNENVLQILAWKAGRAIGGATVAKLAQDKPTLTLPPSSPVRVRVVDEQAHPLEGAAVTLLSRSNPSSTIPDRGFVSLPTGIQLGFAATVLTDSQGSTAVPFGADKDNLGLWIEKKGYQSIYCGLRVPQDDNLTVRLVPGASLKGRLVGQDQRPLANVTVDFDSNANQSGTTKTDAEGNFLLDGLDETTSFLQIVGDEWTLAPQKVAATRGQTLALGTLTASHGGLVTGTMLDEKGQSYREGGTVQAHFVSPEVFGWSKSAFLDKNGHYQLRLPPGQFTIEATRNEASAAGPSERRPPIPLRATRQITLQEGQNTEVNFKTTDEPRPTESQPAVPKPPIPATAPPEKLDVPDYVYGRAVYADTGEPVSAKVSILQGATSVMEAQTKEDGKFALSPLVSPLNPGGAYANIDSSPNAPPLYIVAQAPGLFSTPLLVAGLADEALKLSLEPGHDLQVRVVTTDGKPLAGAKVTLSKISSSDSSGRGRQLSWPTNLLPTTSFPLTDAKGLTVLRGLPSAYVELHVDRDNYAAFNHIVVVPRPDIVELPLSREAFVEGMVRWDDGRPFDFGGARVKLQAFRDYDLWLTGPVDKSGHFEIGKVPSLEMIGDETLEIDLIIDGNLPHKVKNRAEIAPGLSAEYINSGRNWTLIITEEKDGLTKRWISYIQANSLGLKYREGERIQHDMVLAPMTRIKGRVVTEEGTPLPPEAYVSYADPMNTMGYEMPKIKPDAQGNFEVWVPARESVTLTLSTDPNNYGYRNPRMGQCLQLSDLRPQETREIQWKVKNEDVKSGRASFEGIPTILNARVFGPDGATIPRPLLSLRYFQDLDSTGRSVGGMDGAVSLYMMQGDGSVEISSPYMNTPMKVTTKDAGQPLRIQFDRIPEKVAPYNALHVPMRAPSKPSDKNIEKPVAVPVGQLAPELKVERWIEGGPVTLAELRGKVVVVTFDTRPNLKLARLQREFPKQLMLLNVVKLWGNDPVESYRQQVESSSHQLPKEGNQLEGLKYRAVAQDIELPQDWQGYNSALLGANGGMAIIDDEGRIAATNLSNSYALAKISQLLAIAGEKLRTAKN